jgi:hypothetical protein
LCPARAAYPIGRVCLPVTFGKQGNFHTEYLMFEVVDFRSSYHVILVLTPKFGKESDLWVRFDKESVWWKEG